MHYLSFTWHKSLIPYYIKFFKLLSDTIPCYTCYTNFKRKISNSNNSIQNNCRNKERMIKWLIYLHNDVNKSNNGRIYSVKEVKNIYLKNGKIHFKNFHVAKFIEEFVVYNMTLDGPRKQKALKLLQVLAYIYPSFNRRLRLIRYVRKRKE